MATGRNFRGSVKYRFAMLCALLCALLMVQSKAHGATTYLSITHLGEGSTNPAVGVHGNSGGKIVQIAATPAEGWYFDHWEGGLSGSTNPANLTMDSNKRVTAVFMPVARNAANALARYVGKLDQNYSWYQHDSDAHFGWTSYTLRMTSQQWRNPGEVDRTIWEHDVGIIEPWFKNNKVLLLVSGGKNGDNPREARQAIAAASVLTGITYAQVDQIPNQPLIFADDAGRSRSEDAILAYGLDKALVTGDEEWIVHMAMTKAAIRGMDAVQERLGTATDFLVAGGSKRGWTTYLAAATDPRVKAMAPISIDIPNLRENVRHHWEIYGFYTPAVNDYVEFDLFCRMSDPTETYADDVVTIVDPLTYFAKYTMPKLILVSAGDQFFPPDSSRFYYSQLPEPKNLRYTVNTDHSQEAVWEQLVLFALSWADKAINNAALPQFSWTFEPDGSLRVTTRTKPNAVRMWQAYNANARDFRLESIGAAWTSSPLTDQGNGVYVGYVPEPAAGWSAFLVELDFSEAITLTTEVAVTPATLPYAGTACGGPGKPSARLAAGDLNGDGFQDLIMVNAAGDIFYSLNAGADWTRIDGKLSQVAAGDLNGDGRDDIVGVTANGQIFYCTDLTNWIWMPGTLKQITAGDLNGDGRADLVGVTAGGLIFYSLDLVNWQWLPGWLKSVTAGDLNGDGRDDIAGLTADGQIFYSLDLTNWQLLHGRLTQMSAGRIGGNTGDGLVGVTANGHIYYLTDLFGWWQWVPGRLSQALTWNFWWADWIVGLTHDNEIYASYDHWTWFHLNTP